MVLLSGWDLLEVGALIVLKLSGIWFIYFVLMDEEFPYMVADNDVSGV